MGKRKLTGKRKGKGKGKKKAVKGHVGFLEDAAVSVHALKSDNVVSAMGDS